MNIRLISSLLSNVWAIDQAAALGYSPLIGSILGESPLDIEIDFDSELFSPYISDRSASSRPYGGWNNAPKGSMAIIRLNGPLMKNDQYCGPMGMATIGRLIQEADDSPNIDGILLQVDSPGGTVDGTVALAETVRSVSKPIVTFADGLMASAALWIGSAADEIIAADKKTQIGSVGVILSFADLQPAYEKLGVKFHSIVASQSPDKNKLWEDLRAGRYEDYRKKVLDPLADDFIRAMKTHRPDITGDQMTGKVFFAEELLGTLVDSIGNFEFAIARLSELIDQKNTSHSNNSNSASMKNFANIQHILGVDSLESTGEGIFFNEEQLELIEAALGEGSPEEDLPAASQADSANEELIQEISALRAEIDSLRQSPGDETATAVVEKDKVSSGKKDECVVREDKSFIDNLNAVGEEYLS